VHTVARDFLYTFEEVLELKGMVGKIVGALFVKKAKKRNIQESLKTLKGILEKSAAPQ